MLTSHIVFPAMSLTKWSAEKNNLRWGIVTVNENLKMIMATLHELHAEQRDRVGLAKW